MNSDRIYCLLCWGMLITVTAAVLSFAFVVQQWADVLAMGGK